jgi:carboxypeptidase family protein
MRYRVVRVVVSCSMIFLLSATAIQAQSVSTAQIDGTVKDGAGLALPGVTVTVTQTDTSLTRTAITNETGSYTLTNLPIGPYRLEAALQGFRTYVQTGLVLEVNSNPTLNVTLQLGQIAETITVQGSAALVETRNPGIGQVITNQQVVELPLNGRQLTELIFQAGLATGGKLTGDAPGANALNTGVRSYPNTTISVAGGLSNGMTYILDGGTHNDPFNNLNLPLPFPDAMQEFKVETSALPAQYGHHSAAAVNAVTKSGTNVLHGDVFEFMRDDSLNATNAFAAIGPNGKRRSDGLHRDQFGGTLGGPVIQGKLFFFGGYQGTRVNVTPTSFFQFVPTTAMLAGDFSAITSPACNAGRTIPLRAPFVNSRVAPTEFSPAALSLAAKLPKPSNECGQSFFDRKTESSEHMAIGRLDYQWSNTHSILGRYQLARLTSKPDNDPNNVLAYANGPIDDTVHSFVLGDTYLLGPNTVNSFRVTTNSSDISKGYVPFFDAKSLGVRNIATPLPGFTAFTVSGGFTLGPTGAKPSTIITKTFQLVDDISLVRGAHQFGLGANFIRASLASTSYGSAAGNFAFTGVNTGLGLADFLLGRPATFTQGQVYGPGGVMNYIGMYAQDAWKVASNLTLNVGLRWDPYLPYTSDQRHFNHFSLDQFRAGVRSTVYRNAPVGVMFEGDPGYPGHAVSKNYFASFAPRLAGVWDPRGDGRMTMRAAYGRFYDLPHIWNFLGFDRGTPFGTELVSTNGTFDDPWVNTPGGNPFPIVARPDMTFPLYGGFVSFPLDMKPPYADQWNVSVQQQLGAAWMVSANYLTSRGHRLPIGDQLNPALYSAGATTATTNQRRQLSVENPDQGRFYGTITGVKPIGTSEYNGLLLSVQRRSLNGLFVSGNWTLSKCVSDIVNYEPSVAGIELVKPGDPRYDRGSCGSTDQRHVVNLSTVYQVPGVSDGFVGLLTSDWQVSGIVSARSGTHFAATTGVDNALNGQANQRPNESMDDVYLKSGYRWLNPAAFQAPAAGTFGNHENNSLVGPRRFNVDMGLTRSFRIGGERQIQFRAEAFNVLNRVNLNNPVSALNSPNFGLITLASDPRIIQLALKYTF